LHRLWFPFDDGRVTAIARIRSSSDTAPRTTTLPLACTGKRAARRWVATGRGER
jgi:hypothetical protein